jgi:hypothetical protein
MPQMPQQPHQARLSADIDLLQDIFPLQSAL